MPTEKIGAYTRAERLALFVVGEKVRISVRYPWGHYRTPMYIRGKTGRVERVLSEFLNPELEGYGKNAGEGIRLYRISFLQREVWPDYQGPENDTLQIEMYEHWMERV